MRDDKEKLKVFDKNGVYLPMKKVGKNNPKAEQIEADNRARAMWNQTVDRALVSGVPEKQILDVKQSKIGQKAKASIQKSGRNPALFKSLIMTAIYALELLISKVFKTALEKADKVTEAVAKSEPDQTKVRAVNEPVMAQTELIPEMPKSLSLLPSIQGLQIFIASWRSRIQPSIKGSNSSQVWKRRLPEQRVSSKGNSTRNFRNRRSS